MAMTDFLVSAQDICCKHWKMAPFLLFSLVINSCSSAPTSSSGESSSPPATKDNLTVANSKAPLVVATTDVICNLAKTIAKVKFPIAAGIGPHTYAVTSADRQAIEGALQGLSTEEKPTPTRVKKLVTEIKASGVPTVFAEASNSSKLLASVAADAKLKVSTDPLFADGLGEIGSTGDTYPKMLISNTKAITEGLGGKFEAFAAK
jgi:ABC-type Zn uptake system ZnuABC Zn-binding protein ZnuA